nr:retrovirus-related Pol polyprotein from transposon TNT 1-94 [Tanacetum cinerariifolium]
MDFETAQTSTTVKLPIFKQGEYDMWRLRIEKHFQVQDYALWDVIENENSFKLAAQTTTNLDGSLTTLIPGHVTTREKAQKKNDVKARTTKKTQKTLLKHMYENFSALSTYSLDSIFNRLLKIVCQLAILGENISQEDLNLNFLRSLPSEWHTNVMVWRNKPDLDTMSFDDLYNNFKIVKQEVKGTASSSLSLSSQNMDFLSSPSSTNKVNSDYGVSTANTHVSPASAQVSTASTQVSTANLGRKITINGSDIAGYDKSKVKCFNCHKIRHFTRECKGTRNQDSRNKNQDNSRRTVNMEETSSKAMVAIDGASFDWSYMADEEIPKTWLLWLFQTLRPKAVNTTRPNSAVVNAIRLNQWMLKTHDREHVISSDFKEFDGGYVTFGEGAKRGKITSKGTLKTGKLDFEDVYFVKELQFNLFSVSQMCDKKNYVLFTDTGFFVLSPDFKLADKSQVLLKVPRKNNMYNVDMKNIVPKESLTCLAKEVNTACYVKNRVLVVKPHNVTPYKLFRGKFDGKSDEGLFVRYSMNSKAFRVYNIRTRKVEENFHIRFLEDKPIIVGDGPKCDTGKKDDEGVSKESGINDQEKPEISTHNVNTVRPSINTAITNFSTGSLNISTDSLTVPTALLEATHADFLDHSLEYVIGDVQSGVQTRRMTKTTTEQGFISAVFEGKTHEDLQNCLFACFLSQVEPKKTLVDLPYGKRAIGTKWIYKNKKDERGFVVRNKARLVAQGHTQEEGINYDEVFTLVARIETIRLFLAYASFKDFVVHQMDVKSAFLYGKIEEEGLQVTQKDDGIFISQDKYMDEILKKFRFLTLKIASTPMDTSKPLIKDEKAKDVDVHLYRSMIGLLMYLTS